MISTKNVTETTETDKTFTKSVIPPGNHKLKINRVFLKPESKAEFGVRLILAVETPEVTNPSFKPLPIDPTNTALGNHKGQVGNLGYSKWSFRDFLTTTGIQILKEEEILKAIKTICENLNISTWFDEADGRFATIEDFVAGFSSEAPFKDVYAYYCVGGREFSSKDGKHINHELFLPNYDHVLGKAFSLDEKKVQKFFYTIHVEPLKPKTETPKDTPQTELGTVSTEKPIENESAADFLKFINEPVEQTHFKDNQVPNEPVRPKITSPQEVAFMAEAKPQIKTEVISSTPFTDEIQKDAESSTRIVTGNDDPNPWEEGYDEWEKTHKK